MSGQIVRSSEGSTADVHEGTSCACEYDGRHLLIVDRHDPERTRILALRFPPRPDDVRLGMTRLGALRDEYNASIEGNPPCFVRAEDGYQANPDYYDWAARADAWAGVSS